MRREEKRRYGGGGGGREGQRSRERESEREMEEEREREAGGRRGGEREPPAVSGREGCFSLFSSSAVLSVIPTGRSGVVIVVARARVVRPSSSC